MLSRARQTHWGPCRSGVSQAKAKFADLCSCMVCGHQHHAVESVLGLLYPAGSPCFSLSPTGLRQHCVPSLLTFHSHSVQYPEPGLGWVRGHCCRASLVLPAGSSPEGNAVLPRPHPGLQLGLRQCCCWEDHHRWGADCLGRSQLENLQVQ